MTYRDPQEVLEARAAFIARRVEEMKEASEVTILNLLDDSSLLDQLIFSLEKELHGDKGAVSRTLESCVIEMARKELEA